MTFPRRLTPSDKERATIVQQRMTPGGALGAASRHVRPSSPRPNGGNSSTSTIQGSAYYADPGTYSAIDKVINPTDLIQSVGDDSSISYNFDGTDGGLLLGEPGWYQVSAQAGIQATTAGGSAFLQITVSNGQPSGMVVPSVLTAYPPADAALFAGVSTPLFYVATSARVYAKVWGNNGGNIGNAGIYAVKLAG